MAVPKKYLHDKTALLLQTVNAFIAVFITIIILTRIDYGKGGGYIVGYRPQLDLNAYITGSLTDFLAFIVFALLVAVVHGWLSVRVYPARRHAAIAILGIGTVMLLLTTIVSYSLLMLA